jgi:hypothetical protein
MSHVSSASQRLAPTPAATPVATLGAAFKDADLRGYAEAFHARLRGAGMPWAKMVRVTTHLIDVLAASLATEGARAPSKKK